MTRKLLLIKHFVMVNSVARGGVPVPSILLMNMVIKVTFPTFYGNVETEILAHYISVQCCVPFLLSACWQVL